MSAIDSIRAALAAVAEAEKHPDMSASIEHARSMFWNIASEDAIAELLREYDAALLRAEEMKERCASIAQSMQPAGGRMWTDEQAACFDALSECAAAIRAL